MPEGLLHGRQTSDVQRINKELLTTHPRTPAFVRRQYRGVMVGVALLSVAGALWQCHHARTTAYRTQPAMIGSLAAMVRGVGTLQPRKQVNISSELSGTISAVYVETNATVAQGQVLASIDSTRLEAQLIEARSAIAFAEARLRQTGARLREASTSLSRKYQLRELSRGMLPSAQELDRAEAALSRTSGENAAAGADLSQAQASLRAIVADLAKAQIRSPIAGVLLVRAIDPGQTVAASLQAPTLFRVAEDLKSMELHVAIDEADVSGVKVGQQGTFVVDAFPERAFTGMVTRVHLASNGLPEQPMSNAQWDNDNRLGAVGTEVVTYEVILGTDNSDLLLRPGMSASVEIATGKLNDVLLIPNAAMRFTPRNARFPHVDDDGERRGIIALMPFQAERWKCPREGGKALGCVWILQDGEPLLAIFRPGVTDLAMTQVLPLERLSSWSNLSRPHNDDVLGRALSRKLSAGTPIIVGEDISMR